MNTGLRVFLDTVEVGRLDLLDNDNTRFTLSPAYLQLPNRPVLGQTFEDDAGTRLGTRARVPAYFSNLLPEGKLRDLLSAPSEIPYRHEFHLLQRIGEDLPGAIRTEPMDGIPTPNDEAPELSETERPSSPDGLRFSLAGMQLKFSVLRQGERWTLPARGLGGFWIAKLPGHDPDFAGIPENEFSIMAWARHSGLNIPETCLVEVSEIDGLDRWGSFAPGKALLVQRYDREELPGLARRIHQEDFAQVLDVHGAGDGKYEHATFQKIAGLVGLICPEDSVEFLRRLVFMVLSGNGDMHLKNWSLYYPDRIRARLSPAYDLLSTLVYPGTSRKMACKLGRSKEFKEILPHSFEPLAPRLRLPLSTVQDVVAATRERSRRVWSELQGELPMASHRKAWLSSWLAELPLLRA